MRFKHHTRTYEPNHVSTGSSDGDGEDNEPDVEQEEFDAIETPAFLTTSQRGGHIASHLGYSYRKDKRKADGRIAWCCLHQGCHGRLLTAESILEDGESNETEPMGENNHPPIPEHVEVSAAIKRMKSRCRLECTSIRTIYDEESTNLPAPVAALLPSFYSLDSTLFRCRRERYPALPLTRAAINIPDVFRRAQGGEDFFLTSIGAANDTLVFATPADLERLWQSRHWFMDGTFKVVPALYAQLTTIHVMASGKCLPVVYALMSRKTRQAYVDLFRALKDTAAERALNFQMEIFTTDFESGLAPAISEEFPNAVHKGCFFPFCQALYRKVQRAGHQNLYQTDQDVRELIRSLAALAFLQTDQVVQEFHNLRAEQQANLPQLHEEFAYFENTWIQHTPLEMWNVRDLGTRTNIIMSKGGITDLPLSSAGTTQTFGASSRVCRKSR